MMSNSAAAPEKMRMKVKLAASMLVCFNANRQSNELLANAIIAKSVRMKSRVGCTVFAARDEMHLGRGTHNRIFLITEVRLADNARPQPRFHRKEAVKRREEKKRVRHQDLDPILVLSLRCEPNGVIRR